MSVPCGVREKSALRHCEAGIIVGSNVYLFRSVMQPLLFITMSAPPRLASCLPGNLQLCLVHVCGIFSSCSVCMHVKSNSTILCIILQLRCLNSYVFHLQSQRVLHYRRVLPAVTYSACKSRFPLWTPARYTHDQEVALKPERYLNGS